MNCFLCLFQGSDRNGNPEETVSQPTPSDGSGDNWAIALEQFVATALTGEPIVKFFSQKIDLSQAVAKLRKQRFTNLHCFSDYQ